MMRNALSGLFHHLFYHEFLTGSVRSVRMEGMMKSIMGLTEIPFLEESLLIPCV